MELKDAIRRRRMVRRYDPARPVPPDTVDELLGLAVHAPSAGFSQGWRFVVLDAPEARERFWAASTDPAEPADSWLDGMRTAPVLIVALSDRDAYLRRYAEPDKGWTDLDESHWPVPYWDIDTGMASLLVLLGAVDAGLGACFFGVSVERQAAVHEALAIPDELNIVGVISLGHPLPDRRSPSLRRGRRPVAEVVSHNRFGD
ncbi:MAG: nitroreductase family protein [Actinomycetia bacterium]|nr:nitroreductase family protein [Actinomycetes bacterium]